MKEWLRRYKAEIIGGLIGGLLAVIVVVVGTYYLQQVMVS